MFNPLQLIQTIQQAKNPMAFIQNMTGNNPLMARAFQMANGKNPEELQTIAKNLCQQRGINFDEALKQFDSMGLKLPR